MNKALAIGIRRLRQKRLEDAQINRPIWGKTIEAPIEKIKKSNYCDDKIADYKNNWPGNNRLEVVDNMYAAATEPLDWRHDSRDFISRDDYVG